MHVSQEGWGPVIKSQVIRISCNYGQCWGFWTRNKSELHRINTNIKPYLQFSTEQKLSFKLKPRASQERSEAIIILHHIIKLQKKCVTKSNMRQSIIEIGKFIVMSVDC